MSEDGGGVAAFNSGIHTLMRIDRVIISIHENNTKDEPFDVRYLKKYTYVEDLINVSAPLIGFKNYNILMEKIEAIPFNFKQVTKNHDRELNKIIAKVQFSLQDAGNYLMPKKTDTGDSALEFD